MSKKTNISRKFPVQFPNVVKKDFNRYKRWLYRNRWGVEKKFISFILLVLAIFSFILVFIFVELLDQYKAIQDERESFKSELLYWENVIQTVPNSPDVYFQASVAAFQLGDKRKAYNYVSKALELDPNFKEARELEERISNE